MSHAQFAALQAGWDHGNHQSTQGLHSRVGSQPSSSNGASSSSPVGPSTPPGNQVFGRIKPTGASRPIFAPQSPTRPTKADVQPGRATLSQAVRTGTAMIQQQAAEATTAMTNKRTASYLTNLEDLREKEKLARNADLRARANGTDRDERLRLMEELNLTPGPRDFGPGNHPHFEPYSSHRLKMRSMPFDEFQDMMTGRYFLSPSLLYSIKQRTNSSKGTDGDFHIPVDGDWVLIATVTSFKRTWGCKEKKINELESSEEEYEDIDHNGHIKVKRRKKRKHAKSNEPRAKNVDGSVQIEDQDTGDRFMRSVHGSYYDMADLSERDEGDGIKGHNILSLSLVSSHWDEERQQWIGGSRGAYEKLQGKVYGGAVIAIVSPRVIIPKNPAKEAFGRLRLQINPRSADSVHFIGTSLDYAVCDVIKKDGDKCGQLVDRRNIHSDTAVCSYHLSRGITKTQNRRQEFANGTTAIGHGQSGGFGRGTERWRHKSKPAHDTQTPDDVISANSTELQSHPYNRGNRQKGLTVSRRFGALSFEGLAGPGKFFMSGGSAKSQSQLDQMARDPTNARFSVNERYGREKAEKEARYKKKQEEEAMLRRLEITRAGFDLEKVESSQQRHASSQSDAVQDVDGLSLPSHSLGAMAILDARKTLQARKDDARTKEKEKNKRRKVQHARDNPGTNDRLLVFGSESDASDDEAHREKNGRRTHVGAEPAPTSQQTKFRHSAEAIKRMGFDPLSSARNRENRNAEHVDEGASKSMLLSRHTAAPSSLPRPSLKTNIKGAPSIRPPNQKDPLAGATALKFGKIQQQNCKPSPAPDSFNISDSDSDLDIVS